MKPEKPLDGSFPNGPGAHEHDGSSLGLEHLTILESESRPSDSTTPTTTFTGDASGNTVNPSVGAQYLKMHEESLATAVVMRCQAITEHEIYIAEQAILHARRLIMKYRYQLGLE